MSTELRVARAAYYNLFLDAYEAEGAPVERWMEEAGLPMSMRGDPDSYIASPGFLKFLLHAETTVGITDLSGDAIRNLRFSLFNRATKAALCNAPTLGEALIQFIDWSLIENNEQHYWYEDAGIDACRLCSSASLARISYHPNLFQNWAIICIVREFLGPGWTPIDIGFQSAVPPGENVLNDLHDTIFHQHQNHAWVTISKRDLCRSLPDVDAQKGPTLEEACAEAPVTASAAIREIVRPYLRDGKQPKLGVVSEALDISQRSLQRFLLDSGGNYRQTVNAARMDVARELLGDLNASVTEVAMAVGYTDSSHFARAFRRQTGVAPSEYQGSLRR